MTWRRVLSRLSLVGVAGIVACAFYAQRPQAIARPTATKAALRDAPRDVLGTYYQGDGLGANLTLRLTKDQRFSFRWRGCLGEYDRNEGSWQISDDVITLHPERKSGSMRVFARDVRLVPVRWGRRMYLVDENEMPGFAASAKSHTPGLTANDPHGTDYVRVDANFKLPPLEGKPAIPERFKRFYDSGPLWAKVKTVGADGVAVLDKGSADGLRPGLMLTGESFFSYLDLEILDTSLHEARARPWYSRGSDRPPKVGDKFTTGAQWHRPEPTGNERFASLKEIPKQLP